MRVDASRPNFYPALRRAGCSRDASRCITSALVIASAESCGQMDFMFKPHRPADREESAVQAIGRGFRRARARHGLSQRSLAASSGVPQSTISRLETGSRTSIRVAHLARLVAILGQVGIELDDR
jgi:DNA-binding XRE family transcriptional regulator